MSKVNTVDDEGTDKVVVSQDIRNAPSDPFDYVAVDLDHQATNWWRVKHASVSVSATLEHYRDAHLESTHSVSSVFERFIRIFATSTNNICYIANQFGFGGPVFPEIAVVSSSGGVLANLDDGDFKSALLSASPWSSLYSSAQLRAPNHSITAMPVDQLVFPMELRQGGGTTAIQEYFIVKISETGTISAVRISGYKGSATSGGESSTNPYIDSLTGDVMRTIRDRIAITATWKSSPAGSGTDLLKYFDFSGTEQLSETHPHTTRSTYDSLITSPWPLGLDSSGNELLLVGSGADFEVLDRDRNNVTPNWLQTLISSADTWMPLLKTRGDADNHFWIVGKRSGSSFNEFRVYKDDGTHEYTYSNGWSTSLDYYLAFPRQQNHEFPFRTVNPFKNMLVGVPFFGNREAIDYYDISKAAHFAEMDGGDDSVWRRAVAY